MDALAAAIATEGVWFLIAVIIVAGIVRGFAGFGTGLIFIPLAGYVLQPVEILVAVMVIDLIGSFPLLPRALRDGKMKEIGFLAIGMVICLPVGTLLLTSLDPDLFRWIVCLMAFGLVVILLTGWRHSVTFTGPSLIGIGGASGFVGGLSGMPGPPVILAYLSGRTNPAIIRANTMTYIGFRVLHRRHLPLSRTGRSAYDCHRSGAAGALCGW